MPSYPAGVARRLAFARDGWTCLAPQLDPAAGPCYDKAGRLWSGYDPTGFQLEADRINAGPGSRSASHEDPDTLATECPGHHRGVGPNHGHTWGTANRPLLRDHLDKVTGRRETS